MNRNLKLFVFSLVLFSTFFSSCLSTRVAESVVLPLETIAISPLETKNTIYRFALGNERMDIYLPLLEDARIGLVVNHTSLINDTHIVDSLIALDLDIKKIFALEHGYRGKAANGERIDSSVDPVTGLPIVSLYGKNKKPTKEDLQDLDYIVFDIQDVGTRFYTYISSMHYVMEACAENNVNFMVLDRPNPNGHFFDGPVLKDEFRSFVGMHNIPVVHGLTVGELALMINDLGWITKKCNLFIVPCMNYSHDQIYKLREKPSPNLPNMRSVYLYPSLCFFEGTRISVGRGTDFPFQQVGHPLLKEGRDSFVPHPNEGSKYPKLEGDTCRGIAFYDEEALRYRKDRLDLSLLIDIYEQYPEKEDFFLENGFFNLLAGNAQLQQQIREQCSMEEIRSSWRDDLLKFSELRKPFLLYPSSFTLL